MESRMEKYQELDINEFQRSKKNANLYKEVYGNYGELEDLPVANNVNEIDIENLKSLVGSRYSNKRENDEIEINVEEIVEAKKDEKVYDINELLENAKKENAKVKKDVPVNKNVPNYLANLESDKNTKEIILKYDGDDDDDLPIVSEAQYATLEYDYENNKEESGSDLALDILSDLKPSGNTLVNASIDVDIDEEEEKEFFDDKIELTKDDFSLQDDVDDNEFVDENNYTFLKILLIIAGLASIFTAAYFIIKEYTNIF